eukprot:246810-Rhodomonas_salina.1
MHSRGVSGTNMHSPSRWTQPSSRTSQQATSSWKLTIRSSRRREHGRQAASPLGVLTERSPVLTHVLLLPGKETIEVVHSRWQDADWDALGPFDGIFWDTYEETVSCTELAYGATSRRFPTTASPSTPPRFHTLGCYGPAMRCAVTVRQIRCAMCGTELACGTTRRPFLVLQCVPAALRCTLPRLPTPTMQYPGLSASRGLLTLPPYYPTIPMSYPCFVLSTSVLPSQSPYDQHYHPTTNPDHATLSLYFMSTSILPPIALRSGTAILRSGTPIPSARSLPSSMLLRSALLLPYSALYAATLCCSTASRYAAALCSSTDTWYAATRHGA